MLTPATERRPSLPSWKIARPAAPAPVKIVRRAPTTLVGGLVAGRYQVTSVMGAGGMGRVYAATETDTGVEVALKALSPGAFTTTNLRRFRREAEAAASLKHPHLCQVRYLGVESGTPFIVMERLYGETLRSRMKQLGALSVADAITIILQLLDGLSAAHAAGVVHRDVKPGNVFITSPRGRAPFIKIIDFGVAKLMPSFVLRRSDGSAREELSAITQTDLIPGTPFYLTPEQLSGCRDIDERIDVWAAGLTFYEMLIGHRLYDGECHADLARRIIYEPVPPVSSFRCDVPRGIDDVICRALAKNRDERFQSASEFRAAIVDVWARHRAAGVARGELQRRFRAEADTIPNASEHDTSTSVEISVEVDV